MEAYTVPWRVNGEPHTMLIYKSEERMDFPDPSTHIIQGEPSVKVYTCEPYIYREIPPEESDSGPYYYYWFLLAKDQGAADIANQLAQDNAVLQEAANILMGVE